MPDGEDWLLRPVMKGMCRFESLKDGTIDLHDISLMNDALDVVADNEYLVEKAREREAANK
ncbi:hypothetical protein I2F31_02310 [Acinetobacter sp. EC24]|nr:hypothetical protein [Acinetobacter rathckeae]MBF7687082.1 hypothetical protein [Acinetobacter rathckeae]